jgi:DNA-binding CsgD family transcriptional regulator
MNRKNNSWFLAAAGGLGVLGWALTFPFYGPLAYKLLQEQAVWGSHAFALGLALGFLLAAWPGQRLLLSAGVSAMAAVVLAAAALFSPLPVLTVTLMALSGIATAAPTLAWTTYLADTEKRVFPFVAGTVAANLLGYTATLTADTSGWDYGLAILTAAIFISVSVALTRKNPTLDVHNPQPWPLLWPLLVFIIASGYVGGLLYRAIIPALAGWQNIGWLGFWPYIFAFALAGFLASRRYEILPAVTLSVYGLALLPLALPGSETTIFPQLVSLIGTMVGSAFADAFIWLALIYLVSRGHPRVVALGLGLNVLIIWAVGILSDFAVLSSPERMPIASLVGAAMLFILIPVIIPNLAPSPPLQTSEAVTGGCPAHISLLDHVTQPEMIESLTEAEKKVCELLLAGKKNREVAEILFITINTVKYHVRNILHKSDCINRQELITKLLLNQNNKTIGR